MTDPDRCDFCLKKRTQVHKLIAATDTRAAICNECVELSVGILLADLRLSSVAPGSKL